MRQVIFNYYVNVLGKYFFISQSFLYGVLWRQAVTLPHSAQRKHEFWGEIKQMSITKKIAPRKKFCLQLLHQILGHRSTR